MSTNSLSVEAWDDEVTVEVAEEVESTTEVARRGIPWRSALVVVAIAVALVFNWAYDYNPLAQSWNKAKGEWGSYVASASGVEAHHTTTQSQATPLLTTVWDEPTGKFLVQFETEITNTGSRAVRIDAVGEPPFGILGYRTSDYRVSFFRNAPFPNEAGASFHPFTLSGHSERMVTVSYSQFCTTSAPVSEDGRALPSGPTVLPVTFSFFGFAHTDEIPIAPFSFVAPLHC